MDTTSNKALIMLTPLSTILITFRLSQCISRGRASVVHCHRTAHVHSALSESYLGTDTQHQLTKKQNSTLILQATPNRLLTPTLTQQMTSASFCSDTESIPLQWSSNGLMDASPGYEIAIGGRGGKNPNSDNSVELPAQAYLW